MDIPILQSPDLAFRSTGKPDNNPSSTILDDEKIKPMILAFDEKTKLNQLPTSSSAKPSDHSQLHLGAISNTAVPAIAESHEDDDVDRTCVSAKAEELNIWPKVSEMDDCSPPASPTSELNISIKQVISESTYNPPLQKTEQNDDCPVDHESLSPKMEMISRLAYQSPLKQKQSTEQDCLSSSPDLQKSALKNPKPISLIRESTSDPNLHATELAMLDELSLSSSSPQHHSMLRPNMGPPGHDKEEYWSSTRPRLSSVLEESESFSRREFGDGALSYMSTFSSAKHAANVLSNCSVNQSDFGLRHTSYRHNNYGHKFTYDSYEPKNTADFKSSKSAPAGTATRTGSAFGLFRRVSSETSGLKLGRRPVYRPRGPRKQKNLASTILWPLVKIKNGYVGCMMGLEGTGDLSAMAQGGSYATTSRYFAEVPLSKLDSRNYG